MKKRILRLLTVLITAVVLISALNLNASAKTHINEVDYGDLFPGDIIRAGTTITNDSVIRRDILIYDTCDGTTYSNLKEEITLKNSSYQFKDDVLIFYYDGMEVRVYILPHSIVKLHPNGGKFSDNTTGYKTIENVQGTPDNNYLPSSLIPTRTGYTFMGWYTGDYSEQVYTADGIYPTAGIPGGETTYWKGGLWQGAGDKDFIAKWQAKAYTVSFDANGGSVDTTKKIVTYDSAYGNLPIPTRTGYTFAGWYTAASSGTKVTESTKVQTASKHTVYAHWTPNTYGVTLNTNGGRINSGDVTSYTYGTGATLPSNVTKTGYTFGGWYDNSSFSGSAVTSISTTATGAKTYYAKWTPNTYGITLNTNGGTINSGNVTSYTYGTGATLPTDVTKTGYTFGGWYASADFSGSAVTTVDTTETGDKTYYAKWTANTYTVNFNANGGEVATTSTSVIFDQTYGTLPTPTRTGYTFVGWYTDSVNGNKVESSTAVTITDTQALYAHWEKIVYNVTLGESLHGDVNIPTANATMDDAVSVIITPDAGYAVDTVTVNGVSATKTAENQYTFAMPAADAVVAVTYEKIPYSVSLFNGGSATGGVFSADLATATFGDTVTVTVAPNLGYLIESVSVNGVAATASGDGTYSFTMPAQEVTVLVAFDIDLPAIAKELQELNDADADIRKAFANGDEALANQITEKVNAAKTELANTITGLETTLNGKIDDLQNQITANDGDITNIIEDIGDIKDLIDLLEAADVTLGGQISDTMDAVNKAKTELANTITGLETTLNGKIDDLQNQIAANDGDITNIIEDIGDINDLIDLLEAADVTLGGQISDAIRKAERELAAVNEQLKELIGNVQSDLDTAKEKLDNAIEDLNAAMKQGDADLSAEIAALNTALTNAKNALEKADADNKDALVKKIEDADKALDDAVKTVQKNLDAAKAALDKAIKNGDTALDGKITNLNTALESAKAALKATDAANKTELEGKITSAQATLQAAIDNVQTNLNNAKAELDKAIEDLNAAMQQGDADLSAEIAALNTALTDAKNALEKADADNKAELVSKIETADATLDAAIKAVQKNLDDAKAELDKAIADGDTALDTKITNLNTALNNAVAALEQADTDNKAELVKKIEDADASLQAAIDKVTSDLAKAQKDLADAIAIGDASLSSRINSVSASLSAAKSALEKADADNKAALEAKIEAAESTLDAAIKAVQKNLDDAKAELNKAIADGDTALDDKISALNEALTTAKAALEATDSANKSELIAKIDEAYASLDAAVKAVQKNLDDLKAQLEKADADNKAALEAKDAELQAFIIIVCVISGVAFCGCGALAVFYIIEKKKKI